MPTEQYFAVADDLNATVTPTVYSQQQAQQSIAYVSEHPSVVRSREHWFRAGYVAWWTDGLDLPPLLTTSDPAVPIGDAGVLGFPTTSVLLGDESYAESARHGYRLTSYDELSVANQFGLQLDVLGFGEQDASEEILRLDGTSILAVPFYDVASDEESSVVLAYPGARAGGAKAVSQSFFSLIGLAIRQNLLDRLETVETGNRFDIYAGYRFGGLHERFEFVNATVFGGSPIMGIEQWDSFQAKNLFHGVDLGLVRSWTRNRWTFELEGRTAIGSNRRRAIVEGRTGIGPAATFPTGASFDDVGLFGASTNSGLFRDTIFSMQGELAARVRWQMVHWLSASVGYSLFYWSNVTRPSDLIDRGLNPDGFAFGSSPPAGAQRPAFMWRESDFWAQGLQVGIEARW